MIKERNIVVAILLTLVTCGIYGIYWMIVLNDELNEKAGYAGVSGGLVFLFTILTCGIYGIYWYYKMGENVDTIKRQISPEIASTNSSILYVVLGIFGLGIVNYILMQDTLNKSVTSGVNNY